MLFQSGFRFSPINYDLSSGNLDGHFRIMGNMFMADSLARGPLCNVPIMNFGPCMPYGGVSIPGEMLFGYTLNYMDQQSLANRGTSIFGSNGGLDLTGNIFGAYGSSANFGSAYNPFGAVGYTPWQAPSVRTPGSNSSNSSEKTTAELKLEREEEKLRKLLKDYITINKDIDEELKDSIDVALNNDSDSTKEKYDALKEAFKKIDTADLRRVFPNIYSAQLVEAGYDFEDSECFEYENETHTELVENAMQSISDIAAVVGEITYADYTGLTTLQSHFANEDNYIDILNVISLWNEKNDSDRLILAIEKVVKKVPDVGTGDSNEKVTVATQLVGALVESLKAEAKACERKMSKEQKEQKEKLKELHDALVSASSSVKKNPKGASWSDLSKAFDDLYVFLRKQEAIRINKEISGEYSFLNDIKEGTIDEEIIVNDTELDLESEKISDSVIDNYREETTTTKTQREVASMVRQNVLEAVEIDNVIYYQETKMTGGRDYNRVFAIVDDKVKVVKDAKIVDGKLVNLDEQAVNLENIVTEDVNAKDVVADYNKVKEAEEIEKSKNEARKNGAKLCEIVYTKHSNNDADATASSYINSINENNIIEFLNSYIEEEKRVSLQLSLFYKGCKKEYINETNGTNIINAVLKIAKDKQLENTNEYAILEDIRDNLAKDDKDYKSWMWLKGSGFLSYSMAIDNCVETLYNKIKKQEKKQKKQGNKIDIPNG